MSILDPLREIILVVRAAFAWDIVECTITREVQNNSLTGAYRWRFVDLDGVEGQNGPWTAGAPKRMLDRALIEEDTTLADVAQMLATDTGRVHRLDFGTPELTGFALRYPSGKVVTWKEGEPSPVEASGDLTYVFHR